MTPDPIDLIVDRVLEKLATREPDTLTLTPIPPVCSYAEACQVLGISRDHADRLKRTNDFPVRPLNPPLGSRALYSGEELIAAIRSRSWTLRTRLKKGA